ncbi:MAG: MoaD/ThiS family protein [Dehalococcoidia bacterium]|nr:MoaD/ThiS family protein [Dehalococcoidia bacterium]
MIQVEVRLYATLRQYRPRVALGKSFKVKLPAESTIAQLLQRLGIPVDEMKRAFVNGIIEEEDYQVKDGDSIGIFPPIAGGAAKLLRDDPGKLAGGSP